MNWKIKAAFQNIISKLPPHTSYAFYYWIQRHFGSLNEINPVSRLVGAIGIWKEIQKLGYEPKDKFFFEIGTGRVPMAPIAFWLMGAGKITTVDLNPYLKAELTKECIRYIAEHQEEILKIFGALIDKNRLNSLIQFNDNASFSIKGFLEKCCIEYLAPADASKLAMIPPASIDFYTSYNVFEHIPPAILKNILNEGNRIIKDNGLFVHKIDYGDHFSYDDKTISIINFLQYSDDEWAKYAGNSYMYMNRMRHDDFTQLFQFVGQQLLAENTSQNKECLELLKNGRFPLNERFKEKSAEILATYCAWIVLKKQLNNSSLSTL